MAKYANHHRCEQEFEVGDWVLVKLHPYMQQSLAQRLNHKLSKRYFGPYLVEARIGKEAYKLQLPSSASVMHIIMK